VQIHLHETATEIATTVQDHGQRPFERLSELGLVNASLMAVHAVHMTEEELQQFSVTGVSVAHCPRSNLKLASGIAPVQAMLDAGINVALGTDGAASNNVLDMLGEMRTAALLGKVKADDAAAVPASTALRMATLNGAIALGLDDEVGSIKVGKSADLTCVDLNHINSQPVYDPIAQLVYACNREQVSDVWVAGRHQVENGDLTQVDEEEILQRSREWQQRIAAV
jgi:5-methylthioadenosine/S-adenosylhomocysteine deaminase